MTNRFESGGFLLRSSRHEASRGGRRSLQEKEKESKERKAERRLGREGAGGRGRPRGEDDLRWPARPLQWVVDRLGPPPRQVLLRHRFAFSDRTQTDGGNKKRRFPRRARVAVWSRVPRGHGRVNALSLTSRPLALLLLVACSARGRSLGETPHGLLLASSVPWSCY